MTSPVQPVRSAIHGWVRIAVALVLLIVGAAVAWFLFSLARPPRSYSDGIAIHRPVEESTVRYVLWEEPERVPGEFNEAADAYEPGISPDGRTLIFTRGRARQNADLYRCTWTGKGWAEAKPLDALNTVHDELGPAFSKDAKYLYFYSDRPGGQGGYDIWVARWDGFAWAAPVNVGTNVNSAFNEYGPAPAAGGGQLYFSSNRPRRKLTPEERAAWKATLRERLYKNDYDVFCAARILETETNTAALPPAPRFEKPRPVPELNSPGDDGQVVMTPRGDFLYFSSNRKGGQGGFDIYRSRVVHGEIRPPRNLGAPVNTAGNDMDPALRLEGFGLVFSSNRGQDDAFAYRLYESTSRDVFVRVDSSRLGLLWQSLKRVKWWLIVLAAALALLVYLIRNFTDPNLRRKRSLLHTCLLVSALVHALLLFLLGFWMLSQEVLKAMREPSMEVAVDLDALAREKIALDIREDVTALPASSDTLVVKPVARRLPVPEVEMPEPPDRPVVVRAQFPPAPFAMPVQRDPVTEAQEKMPVPEAAERLARAVAPAARLRMEEPQQAAPEEEQELRRLDAPQAADVQRAVPAMSEDAPERTAAKAKPRPVKLEAEALAADVRAAESAPAESELARPAAPATLPARTAALAPMVMEERAAEAAASEQTALARLRDPDRAAAAPTGEPLPDAPVSNAVDVPRLAAAVPARSSVGAPPTAEATEAVRLQSAASALTNLLPVAVAAGVSMETPRPAAAAEPAEGTRMRLARPAVAARRASGRPDAGRPAEVVLRSQAAPARADPASDVDVAVAEAVMPVPALEGFGERATLQLPSVEVASALKMETAERSSSLQYILRQPENRGRILRSLGGDEDTEAAVRKALDWLTAHQEEDGHWEMQKHGGERGHEVAATGMALLCYFGWGAEHTEPGPYRKPTARALDWLLKKMNEDGNLRGKDMYDQGIGTMALTEAYGLTQDPKLREPAAKAVAYIVKAQHNETGGWRYSPRDPGDTSVFGWQVMALKSAEMAGLDVPEMSLRKAREWLEKVGGGRHGGLYGYQDKSPSPAMVAEGMFSRQLLGLAPHHPKMKESAAYLKTRLPDPGTKDIYYFYYATLALYQQQGPVWEEWNPRLKKLLTSLQARHGNAAGSWDPFGPHSDKMGRVVVTAMATLSLEVYYRYLPLYGLDRAE